MKEIEGERKQPSDIRRRKKDLKFSNYMNACNDNNQNTLKVYNSQQ